LSARIRDCKSAAHLYAVLIICQAAVLVMRRSASSYPDTHLSIYRNQMYFCHCPRVEISQVADSRDRSISGTRFSQLQRAVSLFQGICGIGRRLNSKLSDWMRRVALRSDPPVRWSIALLRERPPAPVVDPVCISARSSQTLCTTDRSRGPTSTNCANRDASSATVHNPGLPA
jgi:hypothetical protein